MPIDLHVVGKRLRPWRLSVPSVSAPLRLCGQSATRAPRWSSGRLRYNYCHAYTPLERRLREITFGAASRLIDYVEFVAVPLSRNMLYEYSHTRASMLLVLLPSVVRSLRLGLANNAASAMMWYTFTNFITTKLKHVVGVLANSWEKFMIKVPHSTYTSLQWTKQQPTYVSLVPQLKLQRHADGGKRACSAMTWYTFTMLIYRLPSSCRKRNLIKIRNL